MAVQPAPAALTAVDRVKEAAAEVPFERLPYHLCKQQGAPWCAKMACRLLLESPLVAIHLARQLRGWSVTPELVHQRIDHLVLVPRIKAPRGMLPGIQLWRRGPLLTPVSQLDVSGPRPLLVHPLVWPLLQALLLHRDPDWSGTLESQAREGLCWHPGPALVEWLRGHSGTFRHRLHSFIDQIFKVRFLRVQEGKATMGCSS